MLDKIKIYLRKIKPKKKRPQTQYSPLEICQICKSSLGTIIQDVNRQELFVPHGTRSLPGGTSFHRELCYVRSKTGWRVDVVGSLENLGLTAEGLRTMKTKNQTPENTLKRAIAQCIIKRHRLAPEHYAAAKIRLGGEGS